MFATLFQRFAAEEAERVDFLNIHKWAFRFLTQHGKRPNIDLKASAGAFNTAWKSVDRHSPIADGQRQYFKDEIDWVIKGRGLTEQSAYMQLSRTGRGTPLMPVQREAVWSLYERYQAGLRRAGIDDFADVLSEALRLAEDGAADGLYRSVLIDEAQDLTEVGLKTAPPCRGRRPARRALHGR